MKYSDMTVAGKNILIRKLKLSDAESIYENVKDKAVVKWTLEIPHPYPKDGAAKFILRTHSKIKKKMSYSFGIIHKESDRAIGIVSLINLDWKNKNAEIGYWLGRKYWGKGYMTEAVLLATQFGFKKLKLHKIYAKLFADNTASRKVLEKAGYTQEARLKQTRFRYNRWHDELRYGIFNK